MMQLNQIRATSNYAELRQVFEQILAYGDKQSLKKIAILSLAPQDGKTFFSIALAQFLAESLQKKVLLINASTFQQENSLQPVQLLSAQVHSDDAWKIFYATSVVGLDLCQPLGLSDYQFNQIISDIQTEYDHLVIEAASLSSRNRNNLNPWTLARRCDGVILLSSESSLKKDLFGQATKKLESLEIPVIGMIFNEFIGVKK